MVAALTIALVLALAEGQLYTGIVTTGTVGNKNVDAKLQEVLGECSKSDECPHPKLCVRHSCVCPVIYQGNENCTALQKASDKKARGWCVMPVTSKRFGDYAKGKHWRIARAGKKADRKNYYNAHKIPFDKMFFTDREGWQFREDLRNHFATCAVVGNSDRLKSRPEDKLLGAEIDAHTAVIRFNGAPTKKYKKFVGSRTTLRVQNIAYCGHHEADEFCIHYSRENGGHHNCEQKQWAKCKQINLSKVRPSGSCQTTLLMVFLAWILTAGVPLLPMQSLQKTEKRRSAAA